MIEEMGRELGGGEITVGLYEDKGGLDDGVQFNSFCSHQFVPEYMFPGNAVHLIQGFFA